MEVKNDCIEGCHRILEKSLPDSDVTDIILLIQPIIGRQRTINCVNF